MSNDDTSVGSDPRSVPQSAEAGDQSPAAGITRRSLIKSGGMVGLAAAITGSGASIASAAVRSPQILAVAHRDQSGPDLRFVNGKIHTMDDANSVVQSVVIRDGRFVSVGNGAPAQGPGTRVINLRGRTVVPGLIESHTHFVSLANRPGYHVAELELAKSIAEVQDMLAERRARDDIPEGGFITSMGGWHPNQWAEGRLPTLAELDEAVSDRPVFLFQRFGGPCAVNSLGKEFFENVTSPLAGPVPVSDEGQIAAFGDSTTALYHLRVRQTFEDKKRSALDSMAFTAKLGITALLDQTLVAVATGPRDPQPNHFLANLDHYRMYDAWIDLHRNGEAFVRLQMNFLHNQGFIPELGDLENQLPELRERLKNQFQFFGDHMLRTGAIGEWAAPFATPEDGNDYDVWLEAQRLVAAAGWRNENSQSGEAGIQQVVETYEMMEDEFGISELRWGLQHADHATEDQLSRLKTLNVGVSTSGFRWLTGTPDPAGAPVGPFFPRISESGINAGMHEDGVHIAPHNGWFALHYATTGLNVFGEQINPGQQISREQALYAYTRANAWYLNREDDLGSIEAGKRADLLVLDRDYFTVSDEEMRDTLPDLTIVDGKIVHDTGAVV